MNQRFASRHRSRRDNRRRHSVYQPNIEQIIRRSRLDNPLDLFAAIFFIFRADPFACLRYAGVLITVAVALFWILPTVFG